LRRQLYPTDRQHRIRLRQQQHSFQRRNSALISQVHSALMRVSKGAAVAAPAEPLKSAVPVKRSITPECLGCLEDGKKFKSMQFGKRNRHRIKCTA
jgi:predicted transcriptional regulator